MQRIKHTKETNSSNNHIAGDDEDVDNPLIPGLPDELTTAILSNFSISPSLLFFVCRSWRRLLYSPIFPAHFSLYALMISPTNYQNATAGNIGVEFFTFDPISSRWHSLPNPPPSDPPVTLLYRHPSFLSRKLPIQSVTVSNHLVVIAATTHRLAPALERPLIFDPLHNKWIYGPPLSTPRRWCAAGSARGSIYVASGIGAHYCAGVARSVEEWKFAVGSGEDHRSWRWEKKRGLRDGRFSREAVEAIGYKGKLCMVNVKGNAAKEGAIYDIDSDTWEGMPRGMISGWKGPAASRMDGEDELYVVEEVRGELRKYNEERDNWTTVVESPEFRNAEHISVGRGRVCIVRHGGQRISVVDVTVSPVVVREVAPPPGLVATAVHILPRTCP